MWHKPGVKMGDVSTMATAAEVLASPAPSRDVQTSDLDDGVSYRDRLIQGLAVSIKERGFRETKIADIVRHARTSRRTFYVEFAGKEECFVALLEMTNAAMRAQIAAAVDPRAPWQMQVRQAVEAYVYNVESEPHVTLSWIRELPALGAVARRVQRGATEALTDLLLDLVDNEQFHRAGTAPLSRPLATLLLGGIRELTAAIFEEGGDIRSLTEVAFDAATAVLRPRSDDGGNLTGGASSN
jgi:AcrR family transcriptional regulator